MKKLLGIVVLGLLWCNVAFSKISYICKYDDDPTYKIVFEVKKGKVYRDGILEKTISAKYNRSKAEFSYEFGFGTRDGVTKKIISKTDGITKHEINLKTGIAFETSKWVTKEYDKSEKLIGSWERSSSDTLTCYGGSLNIAEGGEKPAEGSDKAEGDKGKEEDKVLMYCTGGIRCEKASSYLIHHGFKDVNQLNGGIIQYANDIKVNNEKSKFIGKNFVFDHRLGERITDDIIGECHQCNVQSDMHVNCINQACHILFIQCGKCSKKYDGCCSVECADFIKLPKEKQKSMFKRGDVKFTAQKSKSIKPKLYKIKG